MPSQSGQVTGRSFNCTTTRCSSSSHVSSSPLSHMEPSLRVELCKSTPDQRNSTNAQTNGTKSHHGNRTADLATSAIADSTNRPTDHYRATVVNARVTSYTAILILIYRSILKK
ncbi:hypothetical protein DERF_010979 [Dermatophagoides farinae]|uniref:Uncharacterized protein n=1 Tax=Dermatophagoides farinae TaxID=6954 RepID=A0A922HW73_DERFA|nr:hypothetical protein DERF_010979 [Dermatophagoides farinae]